MIRDDTLVHATHAGPVTRTRTARRRSRPRARCMSAGRRAASSSGDRAAAPLAIADTSGNTWRMSSTDASTRSSCSERLGGHGRGRVQGRFNFHVRARFQTRQGPLRLNGSRPTHGGTD